MSNFESPEHGYDFHSAVKCFSPLNWWLVLDSDIEALTLEAVRMSSGQQKRSPQQHRSSLSFSPVGGWKASEQHNPQLPIPKSWAVQWRIAHRARLQSWCWLGCDPTAHLLLCILWSGRVGFLGAATPCVCSEPSPHCHSRCLFQVHPCSSEMPSNYMQTLNKRAV